MKKITLQAGEKFNRLTIVEEIRDSGKRKYRCICDCGNEVLVMPSKIVNGYTKSCGCLKRDLLVARNKKAIKDITGLRSGYLVAIKPTLQSDKNHGIIWECICENCGNVHYVATSRLTSKEVTSCGCTKKSLGEVTISKILKEHNIKFQEQKTFNNCKFDSGYLARFDFYCMDDNCEWLIEFDGKLHFSGVGYGWLTQDLFEKIQEHDKIKTDWAKEHNIELIRIPYTELFNLTIDMLIPKSMKGECL